MIQAVTTYVPIPGHPRPAQQYKELGDRLEARLEAGGLPLWRLDCELEQCWLWQYLQKHPGNYTHSVADNPQKNSLAYHCVQAQKSEWIATAADRLAAQDWQPKEGMLPEVIVWLDSGILGVPGVSGKAIGKFLERAQYEQAVALPGCWNADYEYDDRYPMWRWCGGVWVVPGKYAHQLDAEMKTEYKRHLRETNNLSWEVNTLSRLERRGTSLPLQHYRANHDSSMFSNYRATEHADGRKTQVV
jgi:hypothetical protein